MASRSTQNVSHTEPQTEVDLSVLQKPIQLGVSGALQVAKCLSGGTPEMRELLIEECDIIFECRVCRNLFRSLANFIAHKRVYCQESNIDRNANLVPETPEHRTVMVHPEPPKAKTKDKKTQNKKSEPPTSAVAANTETTEDKVSTDEKSKDDANGQTTENTECDGEDTQSTRSKADSDDSKENGVIYCEGTSAAYQLYTKAMERQQKRQEDMSCSLVELEDVKGNNNAKRQHVVLEATDNDIKQASKRRRGPSHADLALISENIDSHRFETVLDTVWSDKNQAGSGEQGRRTSLRSRGGDGEVANPFALKLGQRKDCDVKSLTCLKCKVKYSSLKTLDFHMISLHTEKRTVYPCLYCKSTFTKLFTATRHLERAHFCPKGNVEKMKKILKKRSFMRPVDEVVVEDATHHQPAGDLTGIALRLKRSARNEEHRDQVEKMKKKAGDSVLQVTKKLADNNKKPKDTTVDFGSGFSLHKCLNCNKSFAKKDSLSRHLAFCFGLEDQIPSRKTSKYVSKDNGSDKKPRKSVPVKKAVTEPCHEDRAPEEKLTSNTVLRDQSGINQNTDKTHHQVQGDENLSDNQGKGKYVVLKDKKQTSEIKMDLGTCDEAGSTETIPHSDDLRKYLQKIMSGRHQELEDKDVELVRSMINEELIECIKCNQSYSSVATLHRHAVRHLAWRRFRCTLCEFTAYNRTECKVHLQRVHLEKTSSNLNRFILDLDPGSMKTVVSAMSRMETKRPNSARILQRRQQAGHPNTAHSRAQSEGSGKQSNFNISTRMSPREFNIRPYKETASQAVMFTRAGSYVKPQVIKTKTDSSEAEDDSETDNSHEEEKEAEEKIKIEIGDNQEDKEESEGEEEGNEGEQDEGKKEEGEERMEDEGMDNEEEREEYEEGEDKNEGQMTAGEEENEKTNIDRREENDESESDKESIVPTVDEEMDEINENNVKEEVSSDEKLNLKSEESNDKTVGANDNESREESIDTNTKLVDSDITDSLTQVKAEEDGKNNELCLMDTGEENMSKTEESL